MAESELFKEISQLRTERTNPRTRDIDMIPAIEIIRLINDEDKSVAYKVEEQISFISQAALLIRDAFRQGGRLFYIGAGTSGRIGVVDASECPPTFGSDAELVQGIIAGGPPAIFKAVEGAEDSIENGAQEIPPFLACDCPGQGLAVSIEFHTWDVLMKKKSVAIKVIVDFFGFCDIGFADKGQNIEFHFVFFQDFNRFHHVRMTSGTGNIFTV